MPASPARTICRAPLAVVSTVCVAPSPTLSVRPACRTGPRRFHARNCVTEVPNRLAIDVRVSPRRTRYWRAGPWTSSTMRGPSKSSSRDSSSTSVCGTRMRVPASILRPGRRSLAASSLASVVPAARATDARVSPACSVYGCQVAKVRLALRCRSIASRKRSSRSAGNLIRCLPAAPMTGRLCAGLRATNSSTLMPAKRAASARSIGGVSSTVTKYGSSGSGGSTMPARSAFRMMFFSASSFGT